MRYLLALLLLALTACGSPTSAKPQPTIACRETGTVTPYGDQVRCSVTFDHD